MSEASVPHSNQGDGAPEMAPRMEKIANGSSASETASQCYAMHNSGRIPKYEDILSDGYYRFLRAGDAAIDIGVNHGLHFDRLKKWLGPKGQVVGFEPVPDFVRVVKERQSEAVDIRTRALSSAPGRSSFLYMTKAIGESGFKERDNQQDRGAVSIEVEISTLDHEMRDLKKLDFIKIDVEGHELSALEGGRSLIERTRPVISIEYGKPTYSLYGLTSESLFDWCERAKYQISDLWGNLVKSREEWVYVCDRSYWDYFLVPRERAETWSSLWA